MKIFALATLAGAIALTTSFAKEVGKEAPLFTAKNTEGEEISLADHKGKVIVLEWVNYDCPFVKKHYQSGNMPKLQETYAGKDVVWLTINSSAVGKQGYLEPSEMVKRSEKEGNKAAHTLMDTDGTIGKAYDAKVTPHLYIIDKEGVLRYNGAIDSKPSTNVADVETADKLFVKALDAVLSGEEVENATNKPYGCGVKY